MSSEQPKNYLTGQQVILLKKSYRQLHPLQVASRFYEKLFALYPQLRHLFPADHSDLMTKLMGVLELVVFSFEEKTSGRFMLQESMIIPLRDLGKKHDDRGIETQHYVIANQLLLEAISEHLGNEFPKAVRESWHVALSILSCAMQDVSVDSEISKSFQGNFKQLFSEFKKRLRYSQ